MEKVPEILSRIIVMTSIFYFSYVNGYGTKTSSNSSSEFLCTNGNYIMKENICDGASECADGSDETEELCKWRPCTHYPSIFQVEEFFGNFRCNYGACIPKNFICDGIRNCMDGSDETEDVCRQRKCPVTRFRCKYGGCVQRIDVCDKTSHCHDKSDETPDACRWKYSACPIWGEWMKCSNGLCISKGNQCNGVEDCEDGEDESEATCGTQKQKEIGSTIQPGDVFKKEPGTSEQFVCSNGEIIPKEYICDGASECADGSDETKELCSDRHCVNYPAVFYLQELFGSFRCNYGACISHHFACDGVRNCRDGSDETEEVCRNKKCPKAKYRCKYGGCIHSVRVCNNITDCIDDSDETAEACERRYGSCSISGIFIKCPDGSCINKDKQCDGVKDCLDGSDESEEICKSQLTTENSSVVETEGPVNGCHKPNERDKIISCGMKNSACNESVVPVGTLVTTFCFQTSEVLICDRDGLWHTYFQRNHKPRVHTCPEAITFDDGVTPPLRDDILPQDCGKISHSTYSTFPWLVGIFMKGKYRCSGTLIGPSLVLTASHCITSNHTTLVVDSEDVKVQLYSTTRVKMATVSSIVVHPQYSSKGASHNFDIALLKLNRSNEAPSALPLACIDSEGKLHEENALIFDRPNEGSSLAWDVRYQTLYLDCFNRTLPCRENLNIFDNQFCGFGGEVAASPIHISHRSSGGPSLINFGRSGEERWTVVGIVSSFIDSQECGPPHVVFTSVNKFYRWIVQCGFLNECSSN